MSFLVTHVWHLRTNLIPKLPDDIMKPRTQCRVGQTQLAFHPIQLSLTANEYLDESQLLIRETPQSTRVKMAIDGSGTTPTMQSGYRQLLTANWTYLD
jgi:hypothetical protein